jgi:hypothetical protein
MVYTLFDSSVAILASLAKGHRLPIVDVAARVTRQAQLLDRLLFLSRKFLFLLDGSRGVCRFMLLLRLLLLREMLFPLLMPLMDVLLVFGEMPFPLLLLFF